MRAAARLALLVALAGCTKPETPPGWKDYQPDAAAPDAAATAGRRKKLKLPPPTPPPARPAGEPKSAADLNALSDQAAEGQPVDKPGAPPIQRIDQYRLRVGQVFVDRKQRRVDIPSRLNMVEGILEYYAVASNGKLHESVLEVLPEPSHIHLGLLLVGLETTVWDRSDPNKMPSITKAGSPLDLYVEWTHDGKTRRERAEYFLYNRKAKGAPPPQTWRFQGSVFWNNRYAADLDRSVVGLIPDEQTVVNIVGDIGNPYRGDDLGYEVYKEHVPPKGTPVTLVLQARGDGEAPPLGAPLKGPVPPPPPAPIPGAPPTPPGAPPAIPSPPPP